MAESTKDERDRMRGLIGHGINEDGTAAKCLRDADRLAKLEHGIRAIEKKYGEYSPADRVSSIHFYRELRALLDD